jgi:hypothetical protein
MRRFVLAAAMILVSVGFRRDAQSIDEPAPTVTTVARVGLAEPFILNRHGDGYDCNRGPCRACQSEIIPAAGLAHLGGDLPDITCAWLADRSQALNGAARSIFGRVERFQPNQHEFG